MAIAFNREDWARIRETYTNWWDQKLDRPVLKVTLQKDTPYTGSIPRLSQATCHRLDISPEDVIERMNFDLEQQEYLGDAFPFVNFDAFGPGIASTVMGARLDNSTGNVWFHRTQDLELSEMHFEFDPKSPWLNRIKDIYHAGNKKWKGNVLMAMPDLGGIMDILSIMCDSENLLYALYDEPEEVKRVSREILEVWFQCYKALEEVLLSVGPGYSDWSGLYSPTPSYVLQCDFSYMIGPDMFREFAAEDLKEQCRRLDHTLYHMDGVGELAHLPQLATMEGLGAIQWCPGDGVPRVMDWMDIHHKIRASGKNIQLLGNEEDLRAVAKEIGPQFIYQNLGVRSVQQKPEMIQLLKDFDVIK